MKRWMILIGVAVMALSPAFAEVEEPIAGNTCHMSLRGSAKEEVLELAVTYLSRPVLEAMFESEDVRADIVAAAGGSQAFVVTATANQAIEFYGTSLAFEQGEDRQELGRSDLLALEGAFGGRLARGESTRGLVTLPASFDPARSITIEYASARQAFLFPSTEPLPGAPKPSRRGPGSIRELESRVRELEERLESLEQMLLEP